MKKVVKKGKAQGFNISSARGLWKVPLIVFVSMCVVLVNEKEWLRIKSFVSRFSDAKNELQSVILSGYGDIHL